MVFNNQKKEKGINWVEFLAFIVSMWLIGSKIYEIGILIGMIVNKGR